MSSYLDKTGLSYLWSKVKDKFVLKETGKGLSSNDFTSSEKQKLQGIAEGANKYVLPTASSSVLGGVQIGNNIKNQSGKISPLSGRLYKATFLLDNWTSSGSTYFQTVSLQKINGSPDVTSSDYLYPTIGIDNSLDDSVKAELKMAAKLINEAKKTLGSNTITVETSKKPTVDAEIYFEIENSLV